MGIQSLSVIQNSWQKLVIYNKLDLWKIAQGMFTWKEWAYSFLTQVINVAKSTWKFGNHFPVVSDMLIVIAMADPEINASIL